MGATKRINPARRDIVNTFEGIVSYDTDNMYPNTFESIIDRSPTAKSVNDVRERFIYGRGMTDSGEFWKKVINSKGHRVDQLARMIIRSYVRHHGFALHFNYNSLFEKTSVKIIPFQFCRTSKPDDDGYQGKIIVYDKWKTTNVRRNDVATYDAYNPDPEIIARQVELSGGWGNYKGQVMFFGENGGREYPLNPLHSVKNDMIAEIMISEGKNSNVSNNFLASQMLVMPGTYKELTPYPDDEDGSRYEQEMLDIVGGMQGAINQGAVVLVENGVKDKEGNPVKFDVVKFDVQNLDKIHEYTEKSCEQSIIKVAGVPEILIHPVTTGFSTEILNAYYQYYNEVVSYDRQVIEEVMMEIFNNWNYNINPSGNYEIKPLTISIDK